MAMYANVHHHCILLWQFTGLASSWLETSLAAALSSGQHPEFVLQVLIQQHHCCTVVPLTHVIRACENVHQPLLEEILITMLRELHPTHHELYLICSTKFFENILAKSVGQSPVAGLGPQPWQVSSGSDHSRSVSNPSSGTSARCHRKHRKRDR